MYFFLKFSILLLFRLKITKTTWK